jgi:hypothetical protein
MPAAIFSLTAESLQITNPLCRGVLALSGSRIQQQTCLIATLGHAISPKIQI